jgi:rRNA biogenesis protein RRP5
MLVEGNVLLCGVQEIEDHGYFLETGIEGVRSFLPMKGAKGADDLCIGKLIFCKVQKISKSVITFSAFKKNEAIRVDTLDVPNMKTLLPGTVVTFNVVQILKNGIEGLLFDGSVTAYVNEMYVPTKLSADPNLIGKQLNARILYLMPLSNQLYATLHTDNNNANSKGGIKNLIKFGTIVEKAKVIKQTSGGILFKLAKDDKGFLPRKTIATSFKDNFDIDSAMLKFSPNSMHTIRVMDYNEFENCYLCTNKDKLLKEKYFGTYDFNIGQIVKAKVEEKLNDGFRLSVGNVRAFLKGVFYHKHAKCEVGSEIRVRVAEVDHDAKLIQVTNLNGFLREGCKILDSKAKLKSGESFTGVVLSDNPKAITVLFFNHFKGFLPKTEDLEIELLSIGGLKEGSVKLFEIAAVKGTKILLKISKKIENHHMGKVFPCKVTAVLPGNGLQIYINELKAYGRIPLNLLSETLHLNEHILSVIKENSNIDVVALGNNEYSRRDVKYFQKEVVTDFKDVKPNDVLRCFVKSSDIDNIELECPLKNLKETIRLNKNAFDNPDDVILAPGEVVYVSVIAKNESHSNSLYVTPSLHKVWINNMDALDMLDNYLGDMSFLLSSMKEAKKPIGNYSTGQRIGGAVKNIIGNNVLFELEEGIFAQGTVENVHNYKVGGQVKDAVIVWIDPIHQILYFTSKDKCKDEISMDQEIKEDAVNEKKHKAIILYSNEHVSVCVIRGSKGFSLIYVPAKRHYNDFTPSIRAIGNATSKLVIKRNSGGKLLGVFVQDSKAFQKLEKLKAKLDHKVLKRSASDNSTIECEVKRPKVVLDDESDDAEDATIEEENIIKLDKNVAKKKNKLDKKQKAKKVVESIQHLVKNSIKISKAKGFINKDSLLDEDVVNLTSYKKMSEGKVATSIGQKHVKSITKSTIGKIKKPKRLIKKK